MSSATLSPDRESDMLGVSDGSEEAIAPEEISSQLSNEVGIMMIDNVVNQNSDDQSEPDLDKVVDCVNDYKQQVKARDSEIVKLKAKVSTKHALLVFN